MKKVLAFAAAVSMISGSAFATGAIDLTTYDAGNPVYYLTSGSLATGSDFYAQILYNGVPVASSSGVSTFALSSGDFDGGFGDVPGTADGATSVSLTLRAWKGTSTYDINAPQGEVNWSQTVGADPGAPTLPSPAQLAVPSSVIIKAVPEPTTIALGMLGAAALLIRRRK
jgi:hypothetical protein